jgi:hypothetical protein
VSVSKSNQQRRRTKAKARKRPQPQARQAQTPQAPGPGPSWWTPSGQPPPEVVARNLILDAMHAIAVGDPTELSTSVAGLTDRPQVSDWRRIVERSLTGELQDAVTEAWRTGWQPVDLARVVRRTLDVPHLNLARDAVAAELQRYAVATVDPLWLGQLAEIDAEVWWQPEQTYLSARSGQRGDGWADVLPCALQLMFTLTTLPRLQLLGPVPGAARPTTSREGPAVDERILSRVRALLAKAESTTFPAEAETFTAGAQALMARHSIDLALLEATAPDTRRRPISRRIGIDNPYEGPKVMLLDAVAKANRGRVVWSKEMGFCTLVGFQHDLDTVETIFTSLLIQSTRAMTKAGSRATADGRSRTRSFRQSFLSSYAARIGERLAAATQTQTQEAAAEPGGQSLLPVLAARDHEVEVEFSTLFPEVTRRSVGSVTDSEGWHRGRSAADAAVLSGGTALPE